MAEMSLREYVREIDGFLEQGRHEEAVAHARHILQHYPKHLGAYRLLGKAMLEVGQDALAEDMFRRVLGGDPEDYVAWVGLSVIHDNRGDLERAIWNMERALDLAFDNEAVQAEIRRLYSRRDGVGPVRVQMTRAALARLYMRGSLLSRAIEELQALLDEEPERMDLRVALAQALLANAQRVQAEGACLQVLDEVPYCLKANLILGQIWTQSGRDEGRVHLQRAETLDPENLVAAELLGEASGIEPREVILPRLEYSPPASPEQRPAWMAAAGLGAPAAEERALVDLEAAVERQIEIPSWLEEVGQEGEGPSAPEGEVSVPEWLFEQAVGEDLPEVETPVADVGEEMPEWLLEVTDAASAVEGPAPDAPPDLLAHGAALEAEEGIAPPGEAPEEAAGGPGDGNQIPDWLKEMIPPGPEAEAQPSVEEVEARGGEEVPEWLAEAREVAEEAAPVSAPSPDAGGAVPSWLEGEGLPSGEEALAWLESLAAGKEDELRAAAEAEAETRIAEIMGRVPDVSAPVSPPEPAPVPEPEPLQPPEPVIEVAPPEIPSEDAREGEPGAFGWTAFGEDEAPVAEVGPAEGQAPEPVLPVAPPPAVTVEEAAAPPPAEPVIETPEVRAAPEEERLPESLRALQEHVRANRRDHEARLRLARELWAGGFYNESVEAYSRLVRSAKLLAEVAGDMQALLEERPSDPEVQRVLGDVYMREGRLDEALEIYRGALENL